VSLLPAGLAGPRTARDGLEAPYWEGTLAHELRVQRCRTCQTWRWGPEWICHSCHGLDTDWIPVEPVGRIYSWERVWHPVHPALVEAVPYVIVLVALPHAGHVRMIGNLAGDPRRAVAIGARVRAVFEDHGEAKTPYTLVQWKIEEDVP